MRTKNCSIIIIRYIHIKYYIDDKEIIMYDNIINNRFVIVT